MAIKPSHTLVEKLREFTEKQRKIIYENTFSIQLTQGCSLGCFDCGAGAEPKLSDYITYDEFTRLLKEGKFPHLNGLYHASDPLDYDFEGIDYLKIHKMASKLLESKPYVSTAVPKGKEEFVLKYLLHGNYEKINGWIQGPFINRVSVMNSNYKRIQKAFEHMEGYKEENQIQFKNWKIDNGIIHIADKNADENLKDEPIYLFNEGTNETLFVVPVWDDYVAAIGRPVEFIDVMEYYKHKQKNSINFLTFTPTEIADYYTDAKPGQIHSKRLGEKFKENLSEEGIGCAHGVILTPKGAFNIQTKQPSFDDPWGWKPEEITPNNFNVIPYKFYQQIHGEKRGSFLKKGNKRLTGKHFINDILTKIRIKTFDDVLYS